MQFKGLRLACTENLNVFRHNQGLGHGVGGIVIAAYHSNTDSVFSKIAHLIGKVQSRVKVLPVTIIKIAGHKNKIYLFFQSKID